MSNYKLEIQDRTIGYKKDEQGKIIDKFFLALDKIIHNFKNVNSQTITFLKTGNIAISVEDRLTTSDNILSCMSAFATGSLNLTHNSFKLVKDIFTSYSFTINIEDFIEFRKAKGTNTPLSLEIKDEEFIKINLLEGDEFIFAYDDSPNTCLNERQDLLNDAILLTPEPLCMDYDEAVKLREMKPTDMVKLIFNISNKTFFHKDYYNTKYNTGNYHILDLSKKFLIGYENRKRKDKYLCSDIEATVYRTKSGRGNKNLILTNLIMINETHILEQTFISLDMMKS